MKEVVGVARVVTWKINKIKYYEAYIYVTNLI